MTGTVRRSLRVLPIATALALVLACGSVWWELSSIRVHEYRLSIPSWRESIQGLRVAVLADLHVGSPLNGLENLRRVVRLTNAAMPDIILLPGDFVIHGVLGGTFVPPDQIAAELRLLHAPLGVFAVMGNHDRWFNPLLVATAFREKGIRLLEDDAAEIVSGRGRFWLVGISDWLTAPHHVRRALSKVPRQAQVLIFTHNPDVFPTLPDGFSLTIAGHTHGGQVNLPLLGRLVVPSRYGQRFAAGHIVESGRHLFVATGIGTSIVPVRFSVPPEISVLILSSPTSPSNSAHGLPSPPG